MVALSTIMPQDYQTATTAEERDAHERLYLKFCEQLGAGGDCLALSSIPWHGGVLVHLMFPDITGALGAIAAVFASRGVEIWRVSAFTASSASAPTGGVRTAVATFHLSIFDGELEATLRERLKRRAHDFLEGDDTPIAGLPESYAYVTTAAERAAHQRMYNQWRKQPIGVKLSWSHEATVADGAHVALYLVFRDVEGSLSVITAALASCGINIKRVAAFTTQSGPAAIDTFQLDTFDAEAEKSVTDALSAHLYEIEG